MCVLTGIIQADVVPSFLDAPWILPVRGYLEDVMTLMVGDVYIGRRCRQRGLGASKFGNPFKPSSHSWEAIRLYGLWPSENKELLDSLWTLSGTSLVCHCRLSQACYADAIIACYSSLSPSSYDREALPSYPPNEPVLEYLAKLREGVR